MPKTKKTTKTVKKKKVVTKKNDLDKDFFTFDDEYNDNVETYKANWNEDEIETTTTTKTVYEVEDNGNDIYIKEEQEQKKEKDYSSMIYILNRIARIVLKVIIVISILIIIDLFLITRFEFGPLFAIRTKTYNDGGTKVYYGLGYKVIRYNVQNGKEGLVVGNYSLKYNPTAKKVDLNKTKLTEENNGDYVLITGKVKRVDKKNKRVVLQIGKNKIYCDMREEFKAYNKISIEKSINIYGRIYIEAKNKLYLERGVVK